MALLNDISVGQLRRAVEIKEHIERLQGELAGIFTKGKSATFKGPAIKRRKMSAAGRARIAAAARARWAKVRGDKGAVDSKASTRKRRTMSAAGRARIAVAQRARWAKIKGR
jgi:hypothetical protein